MAKKYKKWQFCLLAALAIVCAGVAAAYWSNGSNETDVATETAPTETEQTHIAEIEPDKQTVKLKKYDESLGNVYSVQLSGANNRFVSNFNIDTPDAARMNKEINTTFSADMYSDDEINDLESLEFQYGSLCSIVIYLETNVNDHCEIAAYTINTDNGKEVSDSELLSYADADSDDIINQIKTELLYEYEPIPGYDTSKEDVSSDENIKKLFVSDDGEIGAVLHYSSIAGGYDDIYYTGHTAVYAPIPPIDPDWFLTYDSFYRIRDIGDLTITSEGGNDFTVTFDDSNGTKLKWQLDASDFEIGNQGESSYSYGNDFILSYYPGDNHIEITSSDDTFSGLYDPQHY